MVCPILAGDDESLSIIVFGEVSILDYLRNMRFYLLLVLFYLTGSLRAQSDENLHLMIVSGGHSFDETAFFSMFDQMEGITYEHVRQPEANRSIASGETSAFDVLVFYDMYDSISETQKQAYFELLEEGTAMVFLHHSIVSYQQWPSFIDIVGGRYNQNDSSRTLSDYRHDVDIPIHIEKDHPITAGVQDWTMFDEIYMRCEIKDDVIPLLSTTHPQSMPLVGWINHYGSSEVVYLQAGHGVGIYTDSNFLKLLEQSIRWSAARHN